MLCQHGLQWVVFLCGACRSIVWAKWRHQMRAKREDNIRSVGSCPSAMYIFMLA